MAFTAKWIGTPEYTDPYDSIPQLAITGDARRYYVEWGDGETTTIRATSSSVGTAHQYSDGTYQIFVSQNGREPFTQHLQVIQALEATTDLALSGFKGGDYIKAGSGDDVVHGRGGGDILFGGAGNDRLIGGQNSGAANDADLLYGGFGDDVLFGGTGDDRLEGENGADRLTGGQGVDTFAFARSRDADGFFPPFDPDRDTVTDFQEGIDKLDFSQWTQFNESRFIGNQEFHAHNNHSEVRVSFDAQNVLVLSCDWNGDGVEDLSVRLLGQHDLSGSDFIFM